MEHRVAALRPAGIDVPSDQQAGMPGSDWKYTKRPDMTWHDHLIMLLQIGAEIEHALMVQYLYAGYSLGGDQVPEKYRPMIQRWQKNILAIAKEEMGHLLTVQNILTALGGPINLARENFPWELPYSPFPFKLEPLTLNSLSCYVYAEMPGDEAFKGAGRDLPPCYREFEDEDKAAIEALVRARVPDGNAHRVGEIYEEIINIIAAVRPEDCHGFPAPLIADSLFQEDTFTVQASWDDWGRGYQPDPYMLDAQGTRLDLQGDKTETEKERASSREAYLHIDRVATRTQALAALRALAGQGEAPHLKADDTGEPSHFDRFLEIYQEFHKLPVETWTPARFVAENPSTLEDEQAGNNGDYISAHPAHEWAKLFNLRYRILLAYLAHTFRLARVTRPDEPNLRAMVMHKVFGEMYNLKTISGLLVRLPLRDPTRPETLKKESAGFFAGPPFELPYSLRLPPSEADAWRLHRDLLESSHGLCAEILPHADDDGRRYIEALRDLDCKSIASINKILAGAAAAEKRHV